MYDALVVGVPDERLGQRVTAVLSLAGEDPGSDALRAHCRAQLAGYKIPREIHVVEEVHRTPSGKADYGWARQTALG